MRILHLSSFDTSGGAARSAHRIHQGLQKLGAESQMLVQYKTGNNSAVQTSEPKLKARLRSLTDSLIFKLRPPATQWFSPQWFPDAVMSKVTQINPDIINLNWICNGYLQVETVAKFTQPVVWTLQDMWAFTGGCHYSQDCSRYQTACGSCPQLQSQREHDLAEWVWQRKKQAWQAANLTAVAPSRWMAECAESASLFQGRVVEVIPFALDTQKFSPVDSQVARQLLNLPTDKALVLFGAIDATGDKRKGFHLLQAALKRLSQTDWKDKIELVIFGSAQPEKPVNLGFPVHYLGRLQDDLSLRLVYAAADVMIAPSIEEAFGQTASESLACGTPVVVFKNTGLQDIVDHQLNGYLADYCDVKDLAEGIAWVLAEQSQHQKLRHAAREKAEREYAMEVQAARYLALFHKILDI